MFRSRGNRGITPSPAGNLLLEESNYARPGYRDQSQGEHAKQQIRELGQAMRKAARDIDHAYPNTTQGDHIVSEFRQQTNRIVQSSRQHGNRSLPNGYARPSYAATNAFGIFLGMLLVAVFGFLAFLVWSVAWPLFLVLLLFLVLWLGYGSLLLATVFLLLSIPMLLVRL
jgi:hypothetical protein